MFEVALCTLWLECSDRKGSVTTSTEPIHSRKISFLVWSNFLWIFCWIEALKRQVQIGSVGCWWKTCWGFWWMREQWGSPSCSSASCYWRPSLERPYSWYICGRTPEYSHWDRHTLLRSALFPCECEAFCEYRLWNFARVASRGRPSWCAGGTGSWKCQSGPGFPQQIHLAIHPATHQHPVVINVIG